MVKYSWYSSFKDRDNCIVLRVDTHVNEEKGVNPFGFHFEFDRVKYEENKERRKRAEVTRWLAFAAFIHRKLGIRHILLVVIMALYAILGGFMFEAIEAENEKQIVALTVQNMDEVISAFVEQIVNISFTEHDEATRTSMLSVGAKRFYKRMLLTEDRYMGSAWHKSEDLELNIQWTVMPAMFYAFTLFSTIGYGSIACHTWVGRYVSIVYACIGIPLMLLTIGDLGEVLQRMLCKLLNWIEQKMSGFRKNVVKDVEAQEEEEKQNESQSNRVLPMWIAVSILLIYLSLVSVAIYFGDQLEPQETDFPLRASFYFVFISITTTGFGDVMPNSAHYNPLTSLAFLFGLVLLSIINTSVYTQLYDMFYSGMRSMEGALDSAHADSNQQDEHNLANGLSSVFSTLSLSFPSTAFATNLENGNNKNNTNYNNIITPEMAAAWKARAYSEASTKSLQSDHQRSHSTSVSQIPANVEDSRNVSASSEETRTRALF